MVLAAVVTTAQEAKGEWQVNVGVAQQSIRFDDVAQGEPDLARTPVLVAGTV